MNPQSLKILYVGPLWAGSTCVQRMLALQELDHEVLPVNTCPIPVRAKEETWLYRIHRKFIGPKDLAGANQQILHLIRRYKIDLIWLDKSLTIEAATFREIKSAQPACKIVGYSPDDMEGRHNQSRQWFEQLPLYDIFFTTKPFGVTELQARGCPKAIWVGNSFYPDLHRPVPVSGGDKNRLGGPVGFIGNWERPRAATLYRLARSGIPVRVWGPQWNRCLHRHKNLRLEKRCLWQEDYARAICAFDINLGFLSKLNRDVSTSRSVEIPACGGFLLGERTEVHQELFLEGAEAEFFGSEEELTEKVHRYLKDAARRKCLATAGRERCLKAGYSHHDRLKEMLHLVAELNDVPTGKSLTLSACSNE